MRKPVLVKRLEAALDKLRVEDGDIILIKDAELWQQLLRMFQNGLQYNRNCILLHAPEGSLEKLRREDLEAVLKQMDTKPLIEVVE
jgi:hypothetical protein